MAFRALNKILWLCVVIVSLKTAYGAVITLQNSGTVWNGDCSVDCIACSYSLSVGLYGTECNVTLLEPPSIATIFSSLSSMTARFSTNGLLSFNPFLAFEITAPYTILELTNFKIGNSARLSLTGEQITISDSTFTSFGASGVLITYYQSLEIRNTQFLNLQGNISLLTNGPPGQTVYLENVFFEGPITGYSLIVETASAVHMHINNVSAANSLGLANRCPDLDTTVRNSHLKVPLFNLCPTSQNVRIYDSILESNISRSLRITNEFAVENSEIGGFGFDFFCNASTVIISNSTFNTEDMIRFGGGLSPMDITLQNITFKRPNFNPNQPNFYLFLNSDSITLHTSNVVFADEFNPKFTCHWRLSGSINFANPLVASSICLIPVATTTLGGSDVEVTGSLLRFGVGGPTSIAMSSPAKLLLHPIFISSNIDLPSEWYYLPDASNPTKGISSQSTISSPDVCVRWPSNALPPTADAFYLLANGTTATVSVEAESPQYEIDHTFNASTSETYYFFEGKDCPHSCNLNNTMSRCPDSLTCACTPNYAGPTCDCYSAGIVYPFECDPSVGQTWTSQMDTILEIGSELVVPHSYDLNVIGSFQINGRIDFEGGSTVKVSKSLHSNGVLSASLKLLERNLGNSCVVYPELHIEADHLNFERSTRIALVIDTSELSGNCTLPDITTLDSSDSLFYSLSDTIVDAETEWSIHIVGGSAKRATSSGKGFETTLVNSKNLTFSSGTTTLLVATTADSSTCTSFRSSPGVLTLIAVPCETPNPDGSPVKKHGGGVKWYYYGAPLIAVAALTILAAIIILNSRSAKAAILPYRGARTF